MPGIFPHQPLRQNPPAGSRFNSNHALARGLQAFYPFNEGGGTSFAEASMQHPAATIAGGSGAAVCWDTLGAFGPEVLLDSTVGYINAGNICDNMASFTVSLWFKTSVSSGNGTIVGKWGSGGYSSGQGWSVSMDASALTVLTQLSGGSVFNQIGTSSNYNDGKWHHGAFVVSGYAASKIYIDGVKVSTATIGSGAVTTTSNSGNLTFGGDAASDWWNGRLECVGIWNRVLSGDEILRLYVEPFCLISPLGQTLFSKGRIRKTTGAAQTLTPGGIPSQVTHGAQGVSENLLPLGDITHEFFGATTTTTNAAKNIFPAGIVTSEAEGAILFNADFGPLGITSGEAVGTPAIGLNLRSLGVTSAELLGALKAAIATHNPVNVPLRRRSAFTKPPPGTIVNASHPLIQGLAAGWLMNDGGGLQARELLSGIAGNFAGTPSQPAWQSGQFGPAVHFPGVSNASQIAIGDQAAFTDLGLNGSMSVSFWYNYDAAQLALPSGATMIGKSDSTDGETGFTHGWNVNSDNWHFDTLGNPVSSGPQNIKLEFERSIYNKQGGIPAPTTPGIWHHIVITTVGGASTPSVNDYAIYLDGVPQQNIFFVAGTGTDTTSDSGYNLAIGAHPNGSEPFSGYLDVVLLYNRVLTGSEAQQLYTDPFCFMHRRPRRMRATHSTSNLTITPLGIASAGQLGASGIHPAQSIAALGIPSGAIFGSLQAAIATIQTLYPGAIISLESPGADSVIVAIPISTPSVRILNPEAQYRIFNLTIEERIL